MKWMIKLTQMATYNKVKDIMKLLLIVFFIAGFFNPVHWIFAVGFFMAIDFLNNKN